MLLIIAGIFYHPRHLSLRPPPSVCSKAVARHRAAVEVYLAPAPRVWLRVQQQAPALRADEDESLVGVHDLHVIYGT